MTIEWAEPPPSRKNHIQQFVAELQTRPGRWAICPIKSNLGAYRQRFPEVEWITRNKIVYARWIGGR